MRSSTSTSTHAANSGTTRPLRRASSTLGILLVGVLVLALGVTSAQAATWNTNGGTYTRAQINAAIADGDTVNVNADTTFNIDDATDTDLVAALVVFNAVTLTVNFTSTGDLKLGNATDDGNASITVNGTMNVTGAGGGRFDFSPTDTGNVLTIIGTIGGTATGNTIAVGDNELKTMTSTTSLNDVTLSGAAAKLNIDVATSIDTLTVTTAGQDVDIEIADGLTLTIDDQFSIPAGSEVAIIGANGGSPETLTATNGIQLNGAAAELVITGDTGNNTVINAALTVNVDGGIIDMANSAILTSIALNAGQGDLTIETGSAGLTTTVDVNDNTLTLGEAGVVTTVTLDTAGGAITTSASTSIQTLTPSATATITVADNTTLSITNACTLTSGDLTLVGSAGGNEDHIDFNAGLTLNDGTEITIGDAGGAGGFSIDRDGGTNPAVTIPAGAAVTIDVDEDGGATIESVSMTAGGSSNLTLAIGANTLTSPIDVNDNTLTITEAGAGTLTAVTYDTAGGVLDLNTDKTITALNVTHTSGSVTLHCAATKTLGGTVAWSGIAGTLLLDEAGIITDLDVDATGACTLDVNESCTITSFDLDGAGATLSVGVASGKTLTVTNGIDVQDESLLLTETGTVSQVDVETATGTVTLSGAGTVTALNTTDTTAIVASADATITTLAVGADVGVTLGDGVNLTVTNSFNVGANTLTLTGSGGGSQDTFTCTGGNGIVLNNNASELDIAATATADNLTGFEVYVSGAVTPTFDVNETCAPASVGAAAAAGATLTMAVAAGKTCTTTVDINDNTLLLSETGTVSTVQMDTASGEVDVNESCTITTFTPTASCTLDVAGTKNLTITNAVSVPAAVVLTYDSADAANTETLTLTGGLTLAGNASELALTTDETGTMAIAGTITAAADTTIFDIDALAVTLTGLDVNENLTIETGNGSGTISTLTIANSVDVAAGAVLKFEGTDDAAADTLAFTTGLSLNGAAAELEVDGDTTTAMVVTGAITVDTATAVVDVNQDSTFSGTLDLNAAGTVDVANGKTLTIANGVDTNTYTLTVSGTGTISKVDIDGAAGSVNTTADGVITTLTNTQVGSLDIDDDFTITNDFDMGAAMSVDVAATKTLTFTNNDADDDGFNVAAYTLTLSGDGAIDEVTLDTAAFTLDIDDGDIDITSLNISAAGTLNVATGQTWSQTVDTAGSDITLEGGGTISALDVQTQNATRTITVSTGADITVTSLTPDFTGAGAGIGVLVIAATGDLTIGAFADVTEAGDKIQKTGAGSLTITPGITASFANGAGVLLDIDAGTVIIGAAGSNDDITFDDDADEITVASGATLTTFGSFAVGAAGVNANLDAAAGSIVNLNSASGAETFTAVANSDFKALGTVNIAGSDGDYTLGGAFTYQFNDVNVNTTGSFICTVDDGSIEFSPGGSLDMAGSATVTLGSGTDGNEVVMDTIGDTGTFTISRNSSTNLTLNHLDLSRSVYSSATGCGATGDNITLTNVDYTTGNSNWTTGCGGGGGYVPPTTDDPDEEFESDTAAATVPSSGRAVLSATTPSGTAAQVTVNGAALGDTVEATLEDGNSMGTSSGMAGGDGDGNAVPRTLTITSTAANGSFTAVVRLRLTDSDLASATLTDEQVGLYVYSDTLEEWVLAGSNNLGYSSPSNTPGDYGFYTDADGNTVVWVVVDHFSVFAAGEVTTYDVSAAVDPENAGIVTLDPPQDTYADGMPVTLTAEPATGYEFVEWTGDVGDEDATSSEITLAVDAAKSVTAVFAEVEQYTLAVAVDGEEGGSVTVEPDLDAYYYGTEVTLTAEPIEGYEFAGWTGDVQSDEPSITFAMYYGVNVTATFTEIPAEQYQLYIYWEPEEAAEITVVPDQDYYDEGTEVTVTITPSRGYDFLEWTGDVAGTGRSVTVTMNSDVELTALFEEVEVPSYRLAVEVNPTSAGRVTLSLDLVEYEEGGSTTLTAIPDEGYEFDGWTGDIESMENPVTVTLYSDMTVRALFKAVDGGATRAPCGAVGMLFLPLTLGGLIGMRYFRRR